MTTITTVTDLDALIGVRVRITQRVPLGDGSTQDTVYVGRFTCLHHGRRAVWGEFAVEPYGLSGGFHLPYGSEVLPVDAEAGAR